MWVQDDVGITSVPNVGATIGANVVPTFFQQNLVIWALPSLGKLLNSCLSYHEIASVVWHCRFATRGDSVMDINDVKPTDFTLL